MPALTTVYFDGSLGITDANNAWTDDANAFNGNTTTFAAGGGTGFGRAAAGFLFMVVFTGRFIQQRQNFISLHSDLIDDGG